MRTSIYNRNDGSAEFTEIECRVLNETEKAVLITTDGEDELWLPKSQCEVFANHVRLPVWLAKNRKLI